MEVAVEAPLETPVETAAPAVEAETVAAAPVAEPAVETPVPVTEPEPVPEPAPEPMASEPESPADDGAPMLDLSQLGEQGQYPAMSDFHAFLRQDRVFRHSHFEINEILGYRELLDACQRMLKA